MQKWHFRSAIGRGRPMIYQQRSTIVSSPHYIHTTHPRGQEHLKDRVVDEPSKPLFSRAKRLQEANSSIENLYQRSAAGQNSSRGSQNDQPAVLASRYLGGVPLNKDVIDGTQSPSSDGGRFTMDSGRRQPFSRAPLRAVLVATQPVVDARSLGARPEGPQGSLFKRNDQRLVRTVQTTVSERSVSQSRTPQGENGAQIYPSGGTNGFQQRSTRTQRAENADQASQTGFPRGPVSFQAGTLGNKGRPPQAGRNRGGRPRSSQDGDDAEPRRRKRGASGGSARDGRRAPDKIEWTEEEQQYLKEKAKLKSPQALDFEPAKFSRETFTGVGPATASDEWGMSEMLRERMLLAKKYLDREFIQWDSKEQKADVMAMVEKFKATQGAEPTNGSEERAEKVGHGDQQAQALMQKLFGGNYEKFKRPQEKDVVGNVETYVHRNDSYYPDDEKSLLKKVRSIVPVDQASRIARGGRKDVKA